MQLTIGYNTYKLSSGLLDYTDVMCTGTDFYLPMIHECYRHHLCLMITSSARILFSVISTCSSSVITVSQPNSLRCC